MNRRGLANQLESPIRHRFTESVPNLAVVPRIASLTLTGFRNYRGFRLDSPAPMVVVTGSNGGWQDQSARGPVALFAGSGSAPRGHRRFSAPAAPAAAEPCQARGASARLGCFDRAGHCPGQVSARHRPRYERGGGAEASPRRRWQAAKGAGNIDRAAGGDLAHPAARPNFSGK